MQGFKEYLDGRSPGAFVIEEVPEFNTLDGVTGRSYLEHFVKQGEDAGYSVCVFDICHGVFCELQKRRLWIVGISAKQGGQLGLVSVRNAIDEVLRLRKMYSPSKLIGEVINLESVDEKERRKLSRVELSFSGCSPVISWQHTIHQDSL